jgi:hypothetical protein
MKILLLLAAAAWANADFYLGKDRAALFESYVADIRDAQVLSEAGFKRLGTTWEKELERSKARFLAAQTKADVYYALLSLKNSFHDGHSALNAGALKPVPETLSVPFRVAPSRDEKGKLRFTVTQSSIPSVAVGWEVEGHNMRKVEDLLVEFQEWSSGNSVERMELQFADWLTWRSAVRQPLPVQRKASYAFKDPKSGLRARVFARFGPDPRGPQAQPASLPDGSDYAGMTPVLSGKNYKVYADKDAVVLRYSSFAYEGKSPPEAEKADMEPLGPKLRELAKTHKKLVVDVRENIGGRFNERLLQLIARKPFRTTWRQFVFTPLTRRDKEFFSKAVDMISPEGAAKIGAELEAGANKSSRFAYACITPECEAAAKPVAASGVWPHPIHLLIGPYCASGCDQFAAVFADEKMGSLIGLPASGSSSPFRAERSFTLANGDKFTMTLTTGEGYRPSGETIDGNPARPAKKLYGATIRSVLQALP